MREIKFELILKKIDTGECKHIAYELSDIRFGKPFEIDNDEWQGWMLICDLAQRQFTGLLDKNGKDVYEGDIVKILYTDWVDRDRDSMIGKVEYKHDSFQLNFGKGRYGDDEYGYLRTGPHGDFEVIGDIYSSPSLLEQKQ